MDALMLRFLQGYVRGTFGVSVWQAICRRAEVPAGTFEPMLRYAPGLADRVAALAAAALGRPVETIWEDLGTYLVTSPGHEGVRRLLRFGGVGYSDFLHSLEELPGRARLALPDLDLPEIRLPEIHLTEIAPDRFVLECQAELRGTIRVLVGMLTAMADDFGTLCLIEAEGEDRIAIRILDRTHAAARPFDLALPEG